MSSKMKQYNSIDAMKFISAVLIIILHTSPFASYSKLISYGLRNIVTIIAVPFFFCASGFILFKKLSLMNNSTDKSVYFKKYIKRLCIMYLIWTAVYLPFVIYGWNENGFSGYELLQYIKRFFFEGSYSTIWFLPALIAAACFCYFLHKRFPFDKIFCVAVPFYLFACLMTNYYGITEKIPVLSSLMNGYYSFFDTAKNGLLFGFIYVAVGGFLAEVSEDKFDKAKKGRTLCLCAVFAIAVAVESVLPQLLGFEQFGCDIKILLVPFTFFLMIFLLSLNLKDRKIYVYMRKMSLMMFLSQRIFISLAAIFLIDTIILKNSMIYFIFILGTTLAFSDIFIRMSKKIKVLKYCY